MSQRCPGMSQKLSQSLPVPKALGEVCPKRVPKGRLSQSCHKRCLKGIPKIMCSQSVPELAPKPFPKPSFPVHVPNALPKDVPKQTYSQTPCHVADRVGPIRIWSQRSRNNGGIACTHHAFNNTARAKDYCGGIYTGHTSKTVRWEEACEFGQMDRRQGLARA
jgi:hypothetical protein